MAAISVCVTAAIQALLVNMKVTLLQSLNVISAVCCI
jgi:hypothetical protein